jgi:hypothetical protein
MVGRCGERASRPERDEAGPGARLVMRLRIVVGYQEPLDGQAPLPLVSQVRCVAPLDSFSM